jgi:3-oxoadipate enol-lactonase
MSRHSPALHYRREGAGADLILIHGVGSRADDWSGVIAALGGGFATLRYDQRGHGASEAPPGPYTIEDLTGDLVALMDELGIARAHVAGCSLGGLVAQSLALSHPQRVDRLALISTVAGRTAEERDRVVGRLGFIANSHPADYFDQSVERWFTPEFRAAKPEVVAARKAGVAAMDQAAYAAAYHALAHTDFGEALRGIRAKTLIVTGEHDIGSTPRMARFMHEMIAGSALRILPGLRHSLLLEAPGQVARLLRAFLTDAPIPGDAA